MGGTSETLGISGAGAAGSGINPGSGVLALQLPLMVVAVVATLKSSYIPQIKER